MRYQDQTLAENTFIFLCNKANRFTVAIAASGEVAAYLT